MILVCRHCERPLQPRLGPGRPLAWCGPNCRKAARQRATEAARAAQVDAYRMALADWQATNQAA